MLESIIKNKVPIAISDMRQQCILNFINYEISNIIKKGRPSLS